MNFSTAQGAFQAKSSGSAPNTWESPLVAAGEAPCAVEGVFR